MLFFVKNIYHRVISLQDATRIHFNGINILFRYLSTCLMHNKENMRKHGKLHKSFDYPIQWIILLNTDESHYSLCLN